MARRKQNSKVAARSPAFSPVPRAEIILVAVFILPNLGALWCGWVLDDLPIIVSNPILHSFEGIPETWTSPYWPDRAGLTLYRPVTKTIWTLLWVVGGGRAWIFHAAGIAIGALVVLLLYKYLLAVQIDPRISFVAVFLYALFPIHVEATTSAIGSAEVFAAAFGLGSLLAHKSGRRVVAIALFALAVFSKEGAAALPAIAFLAADKPRRRFALDAVAAVVVIGVALWARQAVAVGPSQIPAVDNPMSLTSHFQRVLGAFWIQCLYIWKTLVPVSLSADYSYKQIPLVMGLHHGRAWVGLGLAGATLAALGRRNLIAAGVATWWILFLPASNVVFPIGTMMGERLAYLPSAGLALVVAALLVRNARLKDSRRLAVVLGIVALLYGGRTVARNIDWLDADHFYPKLALTSPDSAKTWYFYGAWRAWRVDDAGAVAAYDRAVEILPIYSEAFHNRGNALVRLGRIEEAKESYTNAIRADPGNRGAAINLSLLQQGVVFDPSRPEL